MKMTVTCRILQTRHRYLLPGSCCSGRCPREHQDRAILDPDLPLEYPQDLHTKSTRSSATFSASLAEITKPRRSRLASLSPWGDGCYGHSVPPLGLVRHDTRHRQNGSWVHCENPLIRRKSCADFTPHLPRVHVVHFVWQSLIVKQKWLGRSIKTQRQDNNCAHTSRIRD